ncbi:hypothetical protein PC111_g15999 [Phytophthora cactorum]|nr:hypothetical protein PC111_g15999 [Phytophthora cactorum]
MLPEKMIHHRADVLLVRGSLLHALSNHAYKAESSLDADQPILDAGTVGGLPFKRSDQCVKNLMLPLGEDKLLLRSITVQLTPGRMVVLMAGAAKLERKVILCAVGLIVMRVV